MFLSGIHRSRFGWFTSVLAAWAVCFVAVAHFLPWEVKAGLLLYSFVSWTLPEALLPEGYSCGEPQPGWWYLVTAGILALGAVMVSLL
jgi:hypothetical protein